MSNAPRHRDAIDDGIEEIVHGAHQVAHALRGLLEHVVEERGHEDDVVHRAALLRLRVDERHLLEEADAAAVGGLVVVEERGELGHEDGHCPDFPHEPHRAVRAAHAHQPEDLLEDARSSGARELGAAAHHRVVAVGVDAEIETRGNLCPAN